MKAFLNKKVGNKLWLSLLLIAPFILLVAYWSLNFIDTDLYYIISTGSYILDNGIPYTNPFIITEGVPIVIQNWLYCVLVSFIYNHLHTTGLWLLMMIFLLLMYYVILKFLHIKKSNNKILLSYVGLIIVWIFGYINLRPEMLTFILLIIELIGVEKYRETDKVRYLWLIPLTTFIEINVHASYWIMHYVLLLPYVIPCFKSMSNRLSFSQLKKFTMPIIVSVITLFLNPYGVDSITYVFKALLSGVFDVVTISEQQPFTSLSYYFFLCLIGALLLCRAYRRRILDSTTLYMFIGTFILFLTSIKWVTFYTIGFMYLLRCYTDDWDKDGKFDFSNLYVPVYCIVFLIMIYVVTISFVYKTNDYKYVFDYKTDEYMNEWMDNYAGSLSEIADYLDLNDPGCGIFTNFEYNNYFEFRGYKVYTDARPELYYNEYTKILNNSEMIYNMALTSIDSYEKVVESVGADYYIFEYTDSTPVMYFEMNDYEKVYQGASFIVYKKTV